jgi:hypothetical protein
MRLGMATETVGPQLVAPGKDSERNLSGEGKVNRRSLAVLAYGARRPFSHCGGTRYFDRRTGIDSCVLAV